MEPTFSRFPQNCEKLLLASSCLSVSVSQSVRLPVWNNLAPTGGIL